MGPNKACSTDSIQLFICCLCDLRVTSVVSGCHDCYWINKDFELPAQNVVGVFACLQKSFNGRFTGYIGCTFCAPPEGSAIAGRDKY